MTRLPAERVLLIIGALISLCVSDNVGPRLLPLPLVPGLGSTAGLPGRGQAASHTPSHGRTTGARVQMVSAPKIRAGAERPLPLSAAHAPKFELAIPSAPHPLLRGLYPQLAESSAPFSRPKGRAPPRLA